MRAASSMSRKEVEAGVLFTSSLLTPPARCTLASTRIRRVGEWVGVIGLLPLFKLPKGVTNADSVLEYLIEVGPLQSCLVNEERQSVMMN